MDCRRIYLYSALVLLTIAGSPHARAQSCCVESGIPDLPASATCDAVSAPDQSWTENIVINQPPAAIDQHAMILMFHGRDQDECWNNYSALADARNDLFNAASAAGWWTVTFNGCTSPVCNPPQDNGTYGSPEMHDHALEIIQYMVDTHQIDKYKVYGFGYSMGGDVLNFAARHLDRDGHGAMLAGVWARSAVTSTSMLWECAGNEQVPLQNLLEATGDPSMDPFAFIQSSSVFHFEDDSCMHAPPLTFDADLSLAHNLNGRYVKLTGPVGDPDNIRDSYEMLDDFMISEGYGTAFYETNFSQTGGHGDWNGFNATDVVNFLAQQTSVEYPAPPQKTIAVSDGTWYWFGIAQDVDREITPFLWDTDVNANKISIRETKNLSSIAFRLSDLGLTGSSGGVDLKVKFQTEDTTHPTTDIVIADYGPRPRFVRLADGNNNLKYYFAPGKGWKHSGTTLTLLDQGGANLHHWLVRP